jgi:DNA-binding ferritin-like protein
MENFKKLISLLLHSRNQVHIFHWQTSGPGSFATHTALGTYYESIVDIIDGLVETYQGKYGILKGYNNYEYLEYDSNSEFINYFELLAKSISSLRKDTLDSYIQNQIDTVEELIFSTLYKLKNLS